MKLSRRNFLLGTGALAVAAGTATVVPMVRREGTLVHSKTRTLPVTGTAGPIPAESDVVIIGGGIQGVLSAINLVERGLSVTIFEKGEVAGEQSGRAYGQVITYKTDPEIFPLHHYGKVAWRKMNEKIGADTSYRTQGRVEAIAGPEDLNVVKEWIKLNQDAGYGSPLNVRIIEGEELKNRLPGAQTDWVVAGFEEDSGSIDPEIATPVLAEYAKKIGVKIYTHCAVRGIETSAGKISHVVTEKGSIKSSRVVLAGGIWSRLFMKNMGVDLPTLNVYLSQQRVSGVPGAPKGNVHLPNGIHFREQADGTYAVAPRIFTTSIIKDSFLLAPQFVPLLGEMPVDFKLGKDFINSFKMPTSWKLDEKTPFEEWRVATATANNDHLDAVFNRMKAEFPIFEKSEVIERWGAVVSPTADQHPIISEVDKYPGLVVNTATTWGMTQSPGASLITADILTGEESIIDRRPYSLDRFK